MWVLKKSKPKTAQESKQKQFHVRKSYKTHESTLLCIGNSEENIDLSRIYLAGQMNAQPKTENLSFFCHWSKVWSNRNIKGKVKKTAYISY